MEQKREKSDIKKLKARYLEEMVWTGVHGGSGKYYFVSMKDVSRQSNVNKKFFSAAKIAEL